MAKVSNNTHKSIKVKTTWSALNKALISCIEINNLKNLKGLKNEK